MANSLLNEKNKKIAAVVLIGGLGFVLIYQFVLNGSTPTAKPKPPASSTGSTASTSDTSTSTRPAAQPSPSAKSSNSYNLTAEKEAAIQQILADTSPLDFLAMSRSKGTPEVGRNIFDYFHEPPKPTPSPPPPPPIALHGMQPQSVVAGTPKNVTVTIMGKPLPPDAQVYFGGSIKASKRLGEGQLSIEVTAAEYSAPRQVNVEVKSQADPAKMYSNSIPFVIQASPLPPFKFVGRIGELGVFELSEGANKEYLRLKKGSTIQGVWHIDAINEATVDVTDTRYSIKKRVALEEKK